MDYAADSYSDAIARLSQLSPGRHYGGIPETGCWTMIGSNLGDVETWEIVPPAASLTYAWGEGGCELYFDGGTKAVRRGDWMWIDAGFAHKGHNHPGSNFLTVFFPNDMVQQASLHVAPIGAYAERAPTHLAHLLTCLAVDLLDHANAARSYRPAIDAILDWVGSEFPCFEHSMPHDLAAEHAMKFIRSDPLSSRPMRDIARELQISQSELSRRFKQRYKITPQNYRKQLRLVHATWRLASGMPVTQAAVNSGFSDAAHLSRTFKSQYGVTPSSWSSVINPR